jgi:hypothetical protein
MQLCELIEDEDLSVVVAPLEDEDEVDIVFGRFRAERSGVTTSTSLELL